jgi:hypothetical protein
MGPQDFDRNQSNRHAVWSGYDAVTLGLSGSEGLPAITHAIDGEKLFVKQGQEPFSLLDTVSGTERVDDCQVCTLMAGDLSNANSNQCVPGNAHFLGA